jgi:hypothetical protein
MLDCSLRSRGSRLEAAAFLSNSQAESVSARSSRTAPRDPGRLESAAVVVARRGKNGSGGDQLLLRSLRLALLAGSVRGGARFPDPRGLAVSRERRCVSAGLR